MITHSPLFLDLLALRFHKTILAVLEDRFGAVPEDIAQPLRNVMFDESLHELSRCAARCADLEAFRERLAKVPTQPPPDEDEDDEE